MGLRGLIPRNAGYTGQYFSRRAAESKRIVTIQADKLWAFGRQEKRLNDPYRQPKHPS